MSNPDPVSPTARSRRVVPDTRRRDTLIAVGAGLLVLGFVVYAVMSLSRTAQSAGGVAGVLARKEFVAQRETQVSFGRGGMTSRNIDGQYILYVRVPEEGNKEYRVFVSERDYNAHQEGEKYYFVRPKPES